MSLYVIKIDLIASVDSLHERLLYIIDDNNQKRKVNNIWHSLTLCTLRSIMSGFTCSISARILCHKSSKLFGLLN
jgi:hypothetical protein